MHWKYNVEYVACDNDPTVLSIDKSDAAAIAKRIKELHTEMNKSIRDKDRDSAGMVAALKTIYSAWFKHISIRMHMPNPTANKFEVK